MREAERWGDDELQDLGRRLPWGALYFRPEAMGTYVSGEPLDPAGTDYVIRTIPTWWEYHRITAEVLADDLAGLPAKLDHVDALAADGRDRRRASRPRPTCRSAPPCACCSRSVICER